MTRFNFKKFLKGVGIGITVLILFYFLWSSSKKAAAEEKGLECRLNPWSTGFYIKNTGSTPRHLACIEKRGQPGVSGDDSLDGCKCPGIPEGKCDLGHNIRWDKRLAPGEEMMCAYSSPPPDCGVFQLDVIEEYPDGSGNWTGAVGNCWFVTNNCGGNWQQRCYPVTPIPTATVTPTPTSTPTTTPTPSQTPTPTLTPTLTPTSTPTPTNTPTPEPTSTSTPTPTPTPTQPPVLGAAAPPVLPKAGFSTNILWAIAAGGIILRLFAYLL